MISQRISALISALPHNPGVYLMYDKDNVIIYIGKAKDLYKRVSQYFLRPQEGKVAAMVSHVYRFETILVKSDKEAFILEMNLIQTHYPRYNIMLMDDSHYPYIALKKGDAYLKIARNTKDKAYYYFGPFPSSTSAYTTIDLLNSIYPTRKCKNLGKKPCLYYSMGNCLAPCLGKLDVEKVEALSEEIKAFLRGDTSKVLAKLKQDMAEASEKLDFELAKSKKEQIDAVNHISATQRVELLGEHRDYDVFAYASRDGYLSLALLTYRNGMMLGKKDFVVQGFGEANAQAIELIEQYYLDRPLPSLLISRIEGLEEEIKELFPEVKVAYPKEGRMADLVMMAGLNAANALDASFLSARLEDDKAALLDELGKLLNIKTPYRIELFDNSHLQGSDAVGAMVCYINGEKAKKMYRKYKLDEEDAGDDYHSMVEVVYRRYSRLKEEGSSYPDLILTDGGLTQVHASLEGLAKAEVDIPVFGLYKNDKHQTEGIIDKDGNTYHLDRESPLFFLLMRMQDEVHRYAISFHVQKRSKSMFKSLFDGIEGIGPKREESLRRRYPSNDALFAASIEELAQMIPLPSAKALYERLHEEVGQNSQENDD